MPNKLEQTRCFPRSPAEAGFVYYVKKGKHGQRTFKVRPHTVKKMYDWLCENNDAYKDREEWWTEDQANAVFGDGWCERARGHRVELRMPTLEHEQAEVDDDSGPAAAQYPTPSNDGETASGFVNVLPAADVQASINAALEHGAGRRATAEPIFHLSSDEGALDEFDVSYFSMAFPEIFLDGSADLRKVGRPIKLELAEWLEHLMWHGGCRAARHKVFCFVAFSMLQRHRAMSQGNFFVSDRMQCSHGEDGAPFSRADLEERVKNGDNSLAHAVFFWAENIRGSDAYMAKLKREIDAITAAKLHADPPQLPSLLISASCAEYYWRPMLVFLTRFIQRAEGLPSPSQPLSEDDRARDLSDDACCASYRFRKLQEYAHVVTLYFERRAMKFIEEVLVPALGIDVFYVVFEFAKGRGQIHFHLLAWLRDGEPHRSMHKSVPDHMLRGTVAQAKQAWDREPLLHETPFPEGWESMSLHERAKAWSNEVWQVVRQGDEAALKACWAAELAAGNVLGRTAPGGNRDRHELPESVRGGGDAAIDAWKAFLLESWMVKHNFRASLPGVARADVSRWPPPEGTRPGACSTQMHGHGHAPPLSSLLPNLLGLCGVMCCDVTLARTPRILFAQISGLTIAIAPSRR